MFAIFRETVIGRILYQLVEIPLYLCLPADDKHSPKHVGEIIYIDNFVILYILCAVVGSPPPWRYSPLWGLYFTAL